MQNSFLSLLLFSNVHKTMRGKKKTLAEKPPRNHSPISIFICMTPPQALAAKSHPPISSFFFFLLPFLCTISLLLFFPFTISLYCFYCLFFLFVLFVCFWLFFFFVFFTHRAPQNRRQTLNLLQQHQVEQWSRVKLGGHGDFGHGGEGGLIFVVAQLRDVVERAVGGSEWA